MGRHELTELSARVERVLDEIQDTGTPDEQERAGRLVAAVMDLYAAGLGRVVQLVEGTPVLRAFADDEVVAGLLLLHDLHPDDVDARIRAALDRVRPYLGSHFGGIDYDGVDEHGVAHLSLQSSGGGCALTAATVGSTIETAVLEAAPEVTAVDLVTPEPDQPLLQIGLRPGLEHVAPAANFDGATVSHGARA